MSNYFNHKQDNVSAGSESSDDKHYFSNQKTETEDPNGDISHIVEQGGTVLVYKSASDQASSLEEYGSKFSDQFTDIGYDANANPFAFTEGAENLVPGLVGYFSLLGVYGGMTHTISMQRRASQINRYLHHERNYDSDPETSLLKEMRSEHRNQVIHGVAGTLTSASIFASIFVHSLLSVNLGALMAAGSIRLYTTQREIGHLKQKLRHTEKRIDHLLETKDELSLKDAYIQGHYFSKRKKRLKVLRRPESVFVATAGILLATTSLFPPAVLFAGISVLAASSVYAAYQRDILRRSYNAQSYHSDFFTYAGKSSKGPISHKDVMRRNVYANHVVDLTNNYYQKFLKETLTQSVSNYGSLTLARLSALTPNFLLNTDRYFFNHHMKRMRNVKYLGMMQERVKLLRYLKDTPEDIINHRHASKPLTHDQISPTLMVDEITDSPHHTHIAKIIVEYIAYPKRSPHHYKLKSEFADIFDDEEVSQILEGYSSKMTDNDFEKYSKPLLNVIRKKLTDPSSSKATTKKIESVVSRCTDYYLGFFLREKAHAQRALWSNLSYQHYEIADKAKKPVGKHSQHYLEQQQANALESDAVRTI